MQNNNRPRRKITIERISVTTIRTKGSEQKFFCNVCGREVEAIVAHDSGSEPCLIVEPHNAERETERLALTPAEKTKLTGEKK